MNDNEFDKLLSKAESEILDFKQNGYDLSKSSGKNSFIKDILAFANTPRSTVARIVIGVSWAPETGSTVIGLSRQFDDAEFQDAISEGRVQPRPKFRYIPYRYGDKNVGILEIDADRSGPYTPIKDYPDPPSLQAGAIYYRSGTQNRRAIGETIRHITTWFSESAAISPPHSPANSWRDFLITTYGYSPGRYYILASDRIVNADNAYIAHLGMIPWRAVIDFDPDSEASGLLANISATIETHRVIHRVTLDESTVQPEPGTHWFFSRGLSGLQNSIETGNHNAWIRRYKRHLSKQLDAIQVALSPTPISVLVLWSQTELRLHLRTLLEEILAAFGDLTEVTVVSPYTTELSSICEEADVAFVELSFRSLCAGIPALLKDPTERGGEDCLLPMSSGAPIAVDDRDRLWFSEQMELLHLGMATTGADEAHEYRRGATASWRNLQLRHDCDRDLTSEVKSQIESDLRRRQTVRINLYHDPGGGGTTVGRRIAWELHQQFPTAVLNNCDPQATADRISKISSLTENSVLMLIDGGEISEREVDSLFDFAKAQNVPVVILQVLRRFRPQTQGRRQFWLDGKLSDSEADRFRNVYSLAKPEKGNALSRLAANRSGSSRTAFYFGLTAFEAEFLGLERYVSVRLTHLSSVQAKIMTYIALAHYYGQQAIPIQLFAGELGIPRTRPVRLSNVFTDQAVPALDLLVEQQGKAVRTSHQWIALEILRQLLSGSRGNGEEGDIWKQQLSRCAKEFADFCRGPDHTASERAIEIASRVFVYRDNSELLGTERSSQRRFSHLIEDIPASAGRIDVLRYLTEEFRMEAHFHAHFARLLGISGNFSEAKDEIDCAISLQPVDPVLHHVRGMIIRYQIREITGRWAGLEEVIALAQQAQESFQTSRTLSSDLEHGYVSEIQMLIGVLDYAGRTSKLGVQGYVCSPEAQPFFRTALERVEELLDQVQGLYVGERPNPLILDCRARVQRLYEDYSKALQAFDNLLSRSDVSKPSVRRQIVWTMLRRRDGNWNNLTTKEVERIHTLLDSNLDEQVNDATSLRLWLRAVRRADRTPTLESVIEKVGYWKANTGALDAAYYLYVLNALSGLEGSSQGLADSERALDECRAVSRFRRDRTRSFEWIGLGTGISRLVHQSMLGSWVGDFWESTTGLQRMEGRIKTIEAPQKGTIELACGLEAFFVPARGEFHRDRDENVAVNCFLGFSYDGPRAWSVCP